MSFPDYVTPHWPDPGQPALRLGSKTPCGVVELRESSRVPTGLDTDQATEAMTWNPSILVTVFRRDLLPPTANSELSKNALTVPGIISGFQVRFLFSSSGGGDSPLP